MSITHNRQLYAIHAGLICLGLIWPAPADAQPFPVGTAFTYQGELESGGNPVDNMCNLQFSLWDSPSGGNQVGPSLFFDGLGANPPPVDVVEGRLTTTLDFGEDIFTGDARWLQIAVCCPSPCGVYTPLNPRQELTPAPYALRAMNGVGPPNSIEIDAATGNVGVGTTSPTAALHVGGAAGVDGIKFPDGTLQTTAAAGGAGDITGVSAGSGLFGGGLSGDVSLSIASDGVTAAMIATDAVGTSELAPNAVTTAEVSADTLTAADLASNSVTADEIATDAVGPLEIAVNAVTTAEIAANAVFAADLAIDPDSLNKITDGTLTKSGLDIVFVNDGSLQWDDTGGTDREVLNLDATNAVNLLNRASGDIVLSTNTTVGLATPRIVIKDDGKVGIGTPGPDATLAVSGTLAVNASSLYVESAGGNVGIGTNTPDAKLDVAGPIINTAVGDATLFYARTNASGTPDSDGIRMRWENAFVGTGDTLIFEKTDGNTVTPDGGIAFVNTGNDGVVETALFIDGSGSVGIGTTAPVGMGTLTLQGASLYFETSSETARGINNAHDLLYITDWDIDDATARHVFSTDFGTVQQMRIEPGNEAAILGDGTFTSNGIDYAEAFKALENESDLEAGEVVSLAIGRWEYVERTTDAYNTRLVGIVSTKPGFCAGMSFDAEDAVDGELTYQRDAARLEVGNATKRGDRQTADAAAALESELTTQLREQVQQLYRPVALAGRVPCKVSGQYGAIQAGDRLTSSATPGHAMKQTQSGPSIGIALEDWTDAGTGKIIVLVQPGWFGVGDSREGQAVSSTSPELDKQVGELQGELEALKRQVAGLSSARK